MAHWIKSDSYEQVVEPENGKKFTPEEVQKLVGGYFKPIVLRYPNNMWVDEDGFQRSLPVNAAATRIYRQVYGSGGPNGGVVVGNVLICTKKEFS